LEVKPRRRKDEEEGALIITFNWMEGLPKVLPKSSWKVPIRVDSRMHNYHLLVARGKRLEKEISL